MHSRIGDTRPSGRARAAGAFRRELLLHVPRRPHHAVTAATHRGGLPSRRRRPPSTPPSCRHRRDLVTVEPWRHTRTSPPATARCRSARRGRTASGPLAPPHRCWPGETESGCRCGPPGAAARRTPLPRAARPFIASQPRRRSRGTWSVLPSRPYQAETTEATHRGRLPTRRAQASAASRSDSPHILDSPPRRRSLLPQIASLPQQGPVRRTPGQSGGWPGPLLQRSVSLPRAAARPARVASRRAACQGATAGPATWASPRRPVAAPVPPRTVRSGCGAAQPTPFPAPPGPVVARWQRTGQRLDRAGSRLGQPAVPAVLASTTGGVRRASPPAPPRRHDANPARAPGTAINFSPAQRAQRLGGGCPAAAVRPGTATSPTRRSAAQSASR